MGPPGTCLSPALGNVPTTGLAMGERIQASSPSSTASKAEGGLPGLRTGFRSLILAVSEKLKDVHFDLGFAQPLGSTVDAVLGQGDGEPLPSAALHGVIQDSSCGQATTGRQLVPRTLLLLLQAPTAAYGREAPASPSTQPSSELPRTSPLRPAGRGLQPSQP